VALTLLGERMKDPLVERNRLVLPSLVHERSTCYCCCHHNSMDIAAVVALPKQ